ncbi:hypothetical protein [Mesorhizobium sp. ES1-3]|uniref:hypothetical protein n=1 Tax=Mesorhizobium sp. ES1-3 TaxID=2876628 RepID=UPI001CCC8D0A|nr:hypothetical protein [Mesorhizobium sp. ES1-3]MBZ9672316.1 hypothetical protein [Mesorhizobium sp. ES1-3]
MAITVNLFLRRRGWCTCFHCQRRYCSWQSNPSGRNWPLVAALAPAGRGMIRNNAGILKTRTHEKINKINVPDTSSGPTKIAQYQSLMANFDLKWASSLVLHTTEFDRSGMNMIQAGEDDLRLSLSFTLAPVRQSGCAQPFIAQLFQG